MDEIDQAQQLSQDFVERAIEANRKVEHKLLPRNKCYNCEEFVSGAKLFCDDECRIDWAARIKRIRGHEIFVGAS